MNERIARYKAIADFTDLARDFKRVREEAEKTKRVEVDANEATAKSSKTADTADQQRIRTRRSLITAMSDYVRSSKETTSADESATRALRDRNREQDKQPGALRKVAAAVAEYNRAVRETSNLERQAGGSALQLKRAREEQTRASKSAAEASERLARAEQRLASAQSSSAREIQAALAGRARAANAAERATTDLQKAEERLQRTPTPRSDLMRKAELALSDARISASSATSRLEAAEHRLTNARRGSGRDNDRIKRAERDVAAAMAASAGAAQRLGEASSRVSGIMNTLQSAGAGLGGIFGGIQRGLAGMFGGLSSMLPKLALFAAAIPLIISLLSVLVSGLGAVGAAAIALSSAIAPAIGILGALPGAIAGAVFAIGTLAAAFFGVGDAVKESLAAQKNAGKVAKDSAKAQRQAARQVADALRALRNAKESQARGEIASNRAIRDSRRALEDARRDAIEGQESAARSVTLAERQLRDAQDSSRRAQINLTRVREDALRNIRELQEATEDAARAERRSAISVEEARLQLQEVLSDPNSTALQKRSAELALEEAQDALDDTQKQAQDTRKEYDKAKKEGVEKSEAVVEARKAETDSIENLKDAQYSLNEALKAQAKQQVDSVRAIQRAQETLADAVTDQAMQQRDAAEAVADAQRNLADAYLAQREAALTTYEANEKLREAMSQLGPEGQKFVALLLTLKPLLDKIRLAAQKGLFPGLGQALTTFAELAPIITPAVEKMGKAIGDAAKDLAKLMTSPIFKGQLKRVLDASVRIMESVGRIIGNLVVVIANIADAARPFTQWLFDTAEGWTEQWKAMTSGKKGQKRLTDFFADAKEALQLIGELITGVVKALYGIGKASKGVGEGFLRNLADAATRFAEFVNSKEGQARIKKWFEDMAPVVKSIALLLRDIVTAFVDIADDPAAADFFNTLRTEFLPTLTELIKTLGSGPARTALDALGVLMSIGSDNISELSEFVGYMKDIASILPDIGSTESSAAKDVVSGLRDAIANSLNPLKLFNDALGAAKKLIKWFLGQGEDELATDKGDKSPVDQAKAKIKDLQKALGDFIRWLKTNWPQILSILLGPFGPAFLAIVEHWGKIKNFLQTSISGLLRWIKDNWAKIFGYLTNPIGSAHKDLTSRLFPALRRAFDDLWDNLGKGGEFFVDRMRDAIDRLRDVFAKPVNFVIDTVINGGLIDGFNALAKGITGNDSLHIDHINPLTYATGGVFPGYTPGRDIGYIGVSGGEAIMRPEWTRAVGKGEVDRMNAAARRGGKKGVQRYLGGFARGGALPDSGGGSNEFTPMSFRGKTLNARTIKMLLAAEKLLGSAFRITQGSWSTSVAASGGTHAGGGAMDLGWTGSDASVRALRRVGFAAWHRNPSQGPWNHHIHAVALGDPTASTQAKAQVASYLAGGNGLGGKDDGPRVAIDPNLANALGITDADIAAAQKGEGGSFLSKLANWVKGAVDDPIGYLKDKISKPIQDMFNQFGTGALTKTLAKVPEMAFSAMATKIKETVGGFLDNIIPGGGSGASGSAEIRSLVQKRAAQYGWDKGGNWDALQWIISKESSWNPKAQNPNSTAYGLFQFLDGTWGDFGASKSSDPGVQTDAGLRYIRSRYGTPEAARAFHQNNGWYASGGVVPSDVQAFARGGAVGGVGSRDTVPAMLTPGEFVLRKDVVKKIGMRKLEYLNNRQSRNLKPTDAGIQHFHSGGPVLGMKKGANLGAPIRALRYLLGWPVTEGGSYSLWDNTLDAYLKRPGAAGRLTGPPTTKQTDPNRWKLINYIRSAPKAHPRTWDQSKKYLKLSDPYMMKMWQSVAGYTQKTMPKAKWGTLNSGYAKYGLSVSNWIGALNKRLGLQSWGKTWNAYGRNAMHHVLEHAYGQTHSPLEYRPWQYFTPVETAAQNQIDANKKQGEFNTALEILSNWGYTNLVTDLLEKGVDQGYNVAISASKNQTVASILNTQIGNAKLLNTEDQANILKMISLFAGSAAQLGLRDMARALKLSDLDTVLLFENATKLGRLSKIPPAKLGRLKSDISSFRKGTFYAAGGGEVPGTGSGDTVPAMLTPGEFVLKKAAVEALGLDTAYWLNDPQKFARGGLVSQFSLAGVPTVSVPRVGAAVRTGTLGSGAGAGGVNITYDVEIINPIAEKGTKSMLKMLQRQSVIKGTQATADK
jgi:hypothetical protein